MQNLQGPVSKKIVNLLVAQTATVSVAFTAPIADTYQIDLVTGTGSGSGPTLDMVLQHSPDGGTTWLNAPIRSAQQTTTGLATMFIFKTRLGESEVALNQATAATGGTLAKNFVPSSMSWRLLFTIGGSGPSYATIEAWLSTQPRSQA